MASLFHKHDSAWQTSRLNVDRVLLVDSVPAVSWVRDMCRYDQEAPEMAKVPEYEDRLSKFERMCVVKTFREDRTLVAASEYVADSLGQKFVESVPLNMERAWAESHKRCPLICLLSRGSDPTKLIEDLAKRKKIKVPYQCPADCVSSDNATSPDSSMHMRTAAQSSVA